ncbi:hypothetical protein Lal_00028171 [Lupinus albus]|nr:hypothetical protein Lal_00028171 [Lupinus albus]
MLLRGKATEDQLQFIPEIEKSAKSNRKKAKAKKKQGVQLESQPSNLAQARQPRPSEYTSPRRGGASCKTTILADSRPGENPPLRYQRGNLAQSRSTWAYWKNLAQARYFRLSENSRPSEKFSPRRESTISVLKKGGWGETPHLPFPPKALKNPRSSQKLPKGSNPVSMQIFKHFKHFALTHHHTHSPYQHVSDLNSSHLIMLSVGSYVKIFHLRTKSTANRDHPPPKKHKTRTSSQATPSHNRNKFTSVEREEHYNTLLQWTFVPERRVDLRRNDYPEFLTKLDELKWGTIASPHDKFDPDVVREFYANDYPLEEGGGLFEHKSWVRGKVIRYDREYLNMMLNNPYQVSEDSLDGYHHLVAQNSTMVHGFRIAETVASLCLPGRSVSGNVDGQPKRIYRKDMTTLPRYG